MGLMGSSAKWRPFSRLQWVNGNLGCAQIAILTTEHTNFTQDQIITIITTIGRWFIDADPVPEQSLQTRAICPIRSREVDLLEAYFSISQVFAFPTNSDLQIEVISYERQWTRESISQRANTFICCIF